MIAFLRKLMMILSLGMRRYLASVKSVEKWLCTASYLAFLLVLDNFKAHCSAVLSYGISGGACRWQGCHRPGEGARHCAHGNPSAATHLPWECRGCRRSQSTLCRIECHTDTIVFSTSEIWKPKAVQNRSFNWIKKRSSTMWTFFRLSAMWLCNSIEVH